MTRELNPNHPVTTALHDHWGSIVAILVSKFGERNAYGHLEIVISQANIKAVTAESGICVEEKPDGIHLTLVDRATAQAIAKREGGLPS